MHRLAETRPESKVIRVARLLALMSVAGLLISACWYNPTPRKRPAPPPAQSNPPVIRRVVPPYAYVKDGLTEIRITGDNLDARTDIAWDQKILHGQSCGTDCVSALIPASEFWVVRTVKIRLVARGIYSNSVDFKISPR